MNKEIEETAANYAQIFDLPLVLILAIIKVESAGNIFAMRMEPPYRYLVDVRNNAPFRELTREENRQDKAPGDFPYIRGVCSRDSEWMGQQCSWGPMQVMGAVAREHGFRGHFPQLCTVSDGVFYGCKHLARYRKVYFERYGWKGVAAAYNAGSVRFGSDCQLVNQNYVDKVADYGAAELFNETLKETEEVSA
ncbi:hypothetical protein [Endozoicomonas sp. 2B-B]